MNGVILTGMLIISICILDKVNCIRFEKHAIVHGFTNPIEPTQDEVPYQATLLAHVNGTYLIFCGGSLIHPRWILTAAHCLEQDGKLLPSKIVKISVGTVYSNLKKAQILDVENFNIHNSYLVSDSKFDIGLVKMKNSVELSKSLNLVKLHTNINEPLIGQTAYLTGFGIINDFYQKPDRLRKAILHINVPEKCQINSEAEAIQLCCTSTIAEGKACKGDSGGPLVIKKNGKIYQIGVTSHLAILPFCKLTFNNSVYTKVASYIPWISAVTGIDFFKYNTG